MHMIANSQRILTGIDACHLPETGTKLLYHCQNNPSLCSKGHMLHSLKTSSIQLLQHLTKLGKEASKLNYASESHLSASMAKIGKDLGYVIHTLLY